MGSATHFLDVLFIHLSGGTIRFHSNPNSAWRQLWGPHIWLQLSSCKRGGRKTGERQTTFPLRDVRPMLLEEHEGQFLGCQAQDAGGAGCVCVCFPSTVFSLCPFVTLPCILCLLHFHLIRRISEIGGDFCPLDVFTSAQECPSPPVGPCPKR